MPLPKIDFTQIAFPSDVITLKMVRQACPEATDIDIPEQLKAIDRTYSRRSLDDVLGTGLMDLERELAERAFRTVFGQPVESGPLNDRRDLIDLLVIEYVRYGLARGRHSAAALAHQIEAQAVAQARQHGGPDSSATARPSR